MPFFFFFFNDTATTEIYTLSLHDALPISMAIGAIALDPANCTAQGCTRIYVGTGENSLRRDTRSEEHTSELQSQSNLVCRLLLEKKKKKLCSVHMSANIATESCDVPICSA